MTKHVYCRVAMLNLHFQKLLGATGEMTKQAYWHVAMFNLHFEDLWIYRRGDAGDRHAGMWQSSTSTLKDSCGSAILNKLESRDFS